MDLTPFHGPPADAPAVPGFVARTLLGFGTHGEVWLADDLTTGGSVALKVGRRLPPGPGATGDPPDRPPDQETALLSRIDHPHIVRLQRVVPLPGGELAMVLDLASGGSLASLVAARGRFDPGEVSTLLVPLAAALGHLHRLGVVHGDIAPGNVLFTGDGRPQLGDLGVARILGTRCGDAWATPGFTDPALTGAGLGESVPIDPARTALSPIDGAATGRGPADGASSGEGVDLRAVDLWGLAAVGWFALTGRPPVSVMPGVRPVDRASVVDHAPALGALLVRCLTAAPADRPSLDELADGAWHAARPTPIRLVTARHPVDELAGLPPLSDRVTRRVPTSVAAAGGAEREGAAADVLTLGPLTPGGAGGPSRSAAVEVPGSTDRRPSRPAHQGWAGRLGATVAGRAPRGSALVVAGSTVVAIGAVVAVGVAAAIRPVGGSGETSAAPDPFAGGRSSAAVGEAPPGGTGAGGSGTGVSGVGGGPRTGGDEGLDAELTRALVEVGRARATAFEQVSAKFLAGADVTGSPAYQEDLALVQRLRARGYRLEGVRYEVTGVQVLHRSGALVDVRAQVTTSRHRQVRIGSGAAVAVPADGPRPVVLTLAPIDRNLPGPGRWRVRSVRAAS